jgi:UDP-MurNAc hydroxylase
MRATSIGHAGILIETAEGSIVCDPWFLPAYFGSWFVFPRNDQLGDELMARIENPTYLYISHLHGDHIDEPWLAAGHINRDTTVLIPGYPTRELERRIRALGFNNIERTVDGEELRLGSSLTVAIHVETSITDGPGGDSAIVVSDGETRLVNQNDCRTSDLDKLRSHGPVDLHWLQFSGAIWYPMVYDEPADLKRQMVAAKVDSQHSRAMRYVEAIDARAVVPSAGPPAFLDPELFGFNVIDGDEPSIFPDQRGFLDLLTGAGRRGILNIPGTAIEVTPNEISVSHPIPDADVEAIFTDKRAYLHQYQTDWSGWLDDHKATWHAPTEGLFTQLKAWFEPLMYMAPTVCAGVSDVVVLHAVGATDDDTLSVSLDFVNREVRPFAGEAHGFWFRIQRELVETVVANKAVDWSNALFLSCRFTAWRAGPFNENVYNFLKSLSVERMRRTESEAVRRADPDGQLRAGMADEDIRIGDYLVQRTCPHRQADLTVFGEIDGCDLVCTLHGWRFDLETGVCRTATDRSGEHTLRIRRAAAE